MLHADQKSDRSDVYIRSIRQRTARHSDHRIQLVDRAIGGDPRIVLAHAAAAEQAGFTCIACAGVNSSHSQIT